MSSSSMTAKVLLDLPYDVIKYMLQQVVIAIELTAAVKLRLVCQIFNREVQEAICTSGLLEGEHRYQFFIPTSSWVVQEYLYRKIAASNRSHDNLPSVIRDAATRGSKPDHEVADRIRVLCKAAARNRHFGQIRKHVLSESVTTDCHPQSKNLSHTNHSVAAAACLGDLEFFIELVKQGPIDSSENIYFGNPLRCAVSHGHLELVKLMLDNGVDVNQAGLGTGFGLPALSEAAFTGREDVLQLLLDPSYDCLVSGDDYDATIYKAASGGNVHIVEVLMRHTNLVPSQRSLNLMLLEATHNGREEMVRYALRLGADPNCWEEHYHLRLRPLTAASKRGHVGVIQILLEYGAIPSGTLNRYSETINLAERRGYRRAVQAFLETGLFVENHRPSMYHRQKIVWMEKASLNSKYDGYGTRD